MPSKRIRSKKSVAAALANLSQTVTRSEQISTPYTLAAGSVSDGAIDQGVIFGGSIANGSVSSKALALSAYVPNGEGIQRVPAPLTDVDYWDDVVVGSIELHNSAIHDGEDIENVSATAEGILFSPTASADARLYLTGRQPIPKSRKVYATWKNTANIPIKIIYWDSAVTKFVDRLKIEDGVVTATTTAAHGFSTGQVVKLTECGPDFNGVYTITVPTDSVDTFTYTASVSAPTNAAEIVLALSGKVAIESFNYVALENKISWEAPTSATEYAVYAELPAGSASRTLTEARVFELIGSGTTSLVTAEINNKAISSNVATMTTVVDHSFKVDDYVEVAGIFDSCTTLDSYYLDTYSNIYTTSPHGFEANTYIYISWAASLYLGGYYYIYSIPSAYQLVLYTPEFAGFGTSFTPASDGTATYISSDGTNTYSDSIFAGQAKITAVTSDTFSFTRISTYGYPSTAVSAPTGIATVGKPRYCYAVYLASSVAGGYIDIYTSSAHGFSVGETVGLSILGTYSQLSGSYVISSASTRYFRVTDSPEVDVSLIGVGTKDVLAYVGSSETAVEMGPDGFRFLNSANSVDTDLGTTSDNYIAVTRVDGKTVASIDNQGAATFTSVSSDDLVVAGTDLIGTFADARYNGTLYTGDYLNRLSRGVVYRGSFNVASGTAVTTKYFSLAYGTFRVEENRHYMLTASAGSMRANATQNSYYELLLSTEPMRADAPGISHMQHTLGTSVIGSVSPMVGVFTGESYTVSATKTISNIVRATTTATVNATSHGLATGDFIGMANTVNANLQGTFSVTVVNANAFTYTTETSGTISSNTIGDFRKVSSLLSETGKLPAGVPIYWQLRLRHATAPTSYTLTVDTNPASTPQMGLTVTDIGQAKPSVDTTQVGLSATMLSLTPTGSGGGGGGTPTTYTTSTTVNASDSAYYDNYGEGTGTSDPYAYRYSLYQGNPGTSSGQKKSAVLFPTVTPPTGATNVTVTKVEVYLRNRHSYNASGLTAYIGVHSSSSLGSSVPAATNGFTPVTSSFTKGQGKWVTLSSTTHTAFKPGAQTARGVLIGLTDDNPDTYYNGITNYGYFDGNTMSDEPKLRITYTYQL